ncbi:MAG: S1 RNA-binding domain-containing protein [Lachnospiraceae bacterium]|nr:S1 RNA-binding domain-containing protein [Lachnospiraceae bacterium]
MIKTGEFQNLTVVNKRDHGVYLGEDMNAGAADRVLLPAKQVPEHTEKGDVLSVFVYRDSEDRLIATTAKPLIALHHTARLRVAQTTKIGAFLAWGLEKDLFLPFHEQTRRVKEGDEVLAALYVDKSGRLAATMKVYPYLRTDSPYRTGDQVSGEVYQVADNFGAFVAVDDCFSGLIPKREMQAGYAVGDRLSLRVTKVHEDGKLDLTAHEKAYLQMDIDAEAVLDVIGTEYAGELPFDDKADPERIREVFGLSKAAFKRAVGRLYKEHRIEIGGGTIRKL